MPLPTINTTTVGLIFTACVTGFAAMWSVKKAISFISH